MAVSDKLKISENRTLNTHHIGIKHTHPRVVEGRNGEEEAHPPDFEQ